MHKQDTFKVLTELKAMLKIINVNIKETEDKKGKTTEIQSEYSNKIKERVKKCGENGTSDRLNYQQHVSVIQLNIFKVLPNLNKNSSIQVFKRKN